MTHPLIGITPSQFKYHKRFPAIMSLQAYSQAVTSAGGTPVLIPLTLEPVHIAELASRLDGVLFAGGGDICPDLFGRSLTPEVNGVIPERDRLELELFRQVVRLGKPFFGICRGIQLVNVAMGGALYLDIGLEHPGAIRHSYHTDNDRELLAHTVRVDPASRLAGILREPQPQVNSLHHQGICRLASGLVPTAWSPDGLIEAVEIPDHPFGIAVQWHPEWLQAYAPMQALFRSFVDTARELSVRS